MLAQRITNEARKILDALNETIYVSSEGYDIPHLDHKETIYLDKDTVLYLVNGLLMTQAEKERQEDKK